MVRTIEFSIENYIQPSYNFIVKKPKINVLRKFISLYFKTNPPDVQWRKINALGQADLKNHLIYINPIISIDNLKTFGIPGTAIYTESKLKLKLRDGEQYFFVLIHEIGHFKKPLKIPKEYIAAKVKLSRLWPSNLEMQHYEAGSCLSKKKYESYDQYDLRIQLFREWMVSGDNLIQHHNVEEWAIREFKKQRKIIRKLLGPVDSRS